MDNIETGLSTTVFIVVGIISLFNGYRSFRRYRLVRDIPRSTVRSLAMGIAEIHGRIKPIELLSAPFSNTKCVWFKYIIEEYRSRRRGSDWVTIASDSSFVPFLAQDDTGEVLVDPTEAYFHTDLRHEYKHDVGFLEGMGRILENFGDSGKSADEKLAKVPIGELQPIDGGGFTWWTNGDRRYREYYLEPDDQLYILGTVASGDRPDEMVVKKGTNNPTFMIGDKSETKMLSSLKSKVYTNLGFGFLGIVGGLALLLWQLGML